MKKSLKSITLPSVVAALYVALTFAVLPLSFGVVQIRFAEALTAYALLDKKGIYALTLGVFLSSLLSGAPVFDTVFGALATLVGTILVWHFREKPHIALLFPVLSNAVVLPFVFRYGYHMTYPLWMMALSVAAGELLSCYLLGLLIFKPIKSAVKKLL